MHTMDSEKKLPHFIRFNCLIFAKKVSAGGSVFCSGSIWVRRSFILAGLDSAGKVVTRKKCSRRQLLAFTANLEVQLMEDDYRA